MIDGMYRVDFSGIGGAGTAIVVFQGGRVFGSDGLVSYDGDYEPTGVPGEVTLSVTAAVPPGAALVSGLTGGHQGFSFDMAGVVNLQNPAPITIRTPIPGLEDGTVTAQFSRLRDLPAGS